MPGDQSPKKWRPSFTYTNEYKQKKKFHSLLNQSLLDQTNSYIDWQRRYATNVPGALPNYNIITELNGQAITNQDKDIEIERLKTTCFDLNNKAEVVDDLRKDNAILTRRLEESEAERERQNEIIRQLQNEIQKSNSEKVSLKNDIASLMNSKSIMQKDLEEAADYNLSLEEKVYKSNKISLDLVAQLKHMKLGLDFFGHYYKVYDAVKSDPVDIALEEYINWSPYKVPLSNLFARESEGVYTFGSKKTTIKVEGTELKVRVGGGFLSIHEFVQQYLPLELEKLGWTGTGPLNAASPLLTKSQIEALQGYNKSMVSSNEKRRKSASPNRSYANIRSSVSIPKMGTTAYF